MENEVKMRWGSWNIKQAAAVLNVTTRTIRNYIKAGKLRTQVEPGKYGSWVNIIGIPETMLTDSDDDTETDKATAVMPVEYQNVQLALKQLNPLIEKQVTLFLGEHLGEIKKLRSDIDNLQKTVDSLLEEKAKQIEARNKSPWYKRLFMRETH